MTYIIRFPIGDWSDDGHGRCIYFDVRSNYSAQDIREVHFKASKIGINIGSICRDYEEYNLTEDMIEKLKKIGIDSNDYYECDNMEPKGLMLLWLDILKYVDPKLELMIEESESQDINFYGMDEKNRHLETPGYGLF